ncbi:MAG: SpoIIE family protein phosphatase [Oscillospiraceae bacterium]|nr:SpoIIE family protein phosphatase [Oscillospiraceae bacterium]
MNATAIQKKPLLRAAALGKRAARSPVGKKLLRTAGYGGAAFLLTAPPLFGQPLPLGAALMLCAELWLPALGALAGACGGYILLWGWEAAMDPIALTLSCFAAALLFRKAPISRSILAAVLTLAVEGLFLLDTGIRPSGLLRLPFAAAVAALLPRLHQKAAQGESVPARLSIGALLVCCGASLGGPVPAVLLSGLLLLPELRVLSLPTEELRFRESKSLPPQKAVENALHTMHELLAREDPILQPLQLAEVYDFAAEQVCRCCVNFSRCWEQNAEETYHDLCTAGQAILQRGSAEREDLPERFANRCRHTAGFLTAVNQSLDHILTQRRDIRRRSEGRRVAAGQYLALARMLEALSRPSSPESLCFSPDLAVGTACKTGNVVSGDRGATCRDRFGCFYVLLCDGMGAGSPARSESDRTARLLTAFLEAGMSADTALDLINGFFVLRKDTAFATLDLLKLDLRTGAGTLYKWGAAPSFLRRGNEVEKIGTVTPPPGLDASERQAPGQYELSLSEGETLVMVSDGASGEETVQQLTEFSEGSVRDLASCLITLGASDAADDRTAVVIRLRSLRSA